MTPPRIILDKNVVQGGKTSAIVELCQSGLGVMPDVLFYEMLTTSEPARSRCFAKFPGENPVTLVPNVGELLQYETDNHKACGRPTGHALPTRYRFNPKLATGTYVLPEEAAATLREEEERLRGELRILIDSVNSAPALFGHAFQGHDREAARTRYENALANDPNEIVEFYRHLDAPAGAVPAELLTNEWLHFRWLQVRLWAALDLRLRLGPIEPDPQGERRHRLENYLFDMQYAMLALLEGGLATEDDWLRDLFKALRPDGLLVPDDEELSAKREKARERVALANPPRVDQPLEDEPQEGANA